MTPDQEPSEAELDNEIDASKEWNELATFLPENLLALARHSLRYEARLRRFKKVPERVIKVKIDGQEGFIYPLLNVTWDFDNFFAFAHKIVDLGLVRFQVS